MSGLELTVRLAEALGWPITALMIVLILRHPLRQMLANRPPSKVKAGPFEVEWDRVLAETEKEVEASAAPSRAGSIPGTVREELSAEATIAPAVAVLEAHATVERTLREMLAAAEVPAEQTSRAGAVRLARLAQQAGLVTPETVNAIEGISVMRNLAAHGSAREITSEQAMEYLTLVDAVLYALKTRA